MDEKQVHYDISVPQNGDDSSEKSSTGTLQDRNPGASNIKQSETDALSKIPFPSPGDSSVIATVFGASEDVTLTARGAPIHKLSEQISQNSFSTDDAACGKLQNVSLFVSTEDRVDTTAALNRRLTENVLLDNSHSGSGAEDRTPVVQASTIFPEIQQIEERLNALLSYETPENPEVVSQEREAEFENLLSRVPVVPQTDNINDVSNLLDSLPSPPTSPCKMNFVNSADDGQTELSRPHSTEHCSSTSSRSLSRSYRFSSASVDSSRPIPDRRQDGYGETQILVPQYKSDGNGYCWPTVILPLGGNLRFDENKQWETSGLIGEGASGACYIASITANNASNHILCVKKVNNYNREEVLSLYLSAKDQKEPMLPMLTGSKDIVPFYGATYWKHEVRIFMELMEGGTVHDLLKDMTGELSKDLYMQYLADVLSALDFLHGKGIVHNDVKSANVLLDINKLQAKLADFGNASPIYDNTKQMKNDVWSAGCFLLEMIKYCDRKILSMRQHLVKADEIPQHDDQNTNDILQLFFNNKNQQYNANYILRELNNRISSMNMWNKPSNE